MARKFIEPIQESILAQPSLLSKWLDRFRRQAAIIDTLTVSVAVPALPAGATVTAAVAVVGVESGDRICGFTYQYQAPLYLAPGWITFDAWVFGTDQVQFSWHNPTAGALGGIPAPYEICVLKYKRPI